MPRRALAKVRIDRFDFRGFRGYVSCCGLHVEQLDDGRTLVICTERPDNPGTSVTNAAEIIASRVASQLALDPAKLIWIEHYPPSKLHGESEDFDLVTFGSIVHDGIHTVFDDPCWRPVNSEDWQSIGLVPIDFVP